MSQSKALGTLGKAAPAMMLLFTFCLSSATKAIADHKPPSCIDTPPYDTTPYKAERFVRVAPGRQTGGAGLGGSGKVMVLLTGSGDNAHVFDYFAFQFTNYFHVIGITRRGWLPSSQPKNGYDVETRAADDIKILDALGIKKAVFVGHSIAGSELSKIAVNIQVMSINQSISTLPTYHRGSRSPMYLIRVLCLLARTLDHYFLSRQPMRGLLESANQSLRSACPISLTKMEGLRIPRHRNRSRLSFPRVQIFRQIHQRIGQKSRCRGSAFSLHRLPRARYPGTGT